MNNDFYQNIGARLRRQREALGFTRDNLSELSSVSIQFIADIELGKKGFTVDTLSKLCLALKVSADYIIFGREELTDVQEIAHLLETLDKKYLDLAHEHLKIFLMTVQTLNEN